MRYVPGLLGLFREQIVKRCQRTHLVAYALELADWNRLSVGDHLHVDECGYHLKVVLYAVVRFRHRALETLVEAADVLSAALEPLFVHISKAREAHQARYGLQEIEVVIGKLASAGRGADEDAGLFPGACRDERSIPTLIRV